MAHLIWVIFICAFASRKSPASKASLLPNIKSWFEGKLLPKFLKLDRSKIPFWCTMFPMWMSWTALVKSF